MKSCGVIITNPNEYTPAAASGYVTRTRRWREEGREEGEGGRVEGGKKRNRHKVERVHTVCKRIDQPRPPALMRIVEQRVHPPHRDKGVERDGEIVPAP